ncbi:tRNA-uridine aminocarboxypropyltransferase 1-like [Liolophura sinensis]|uniref:tRNA-uridine aminocarboxypropyltransferase 1-like n=1 Tax=Liolophura sinensis TaxID=3198878 RepID=UPI0031592030
MLLSFEPPISMTCEDASDRHDNEFHSLRTQPREFLDQIKGRSLCPKCGKSRKFYCYTCYILMEDVKTKLKQVKLPVKVDIIKHPNEVDGKSTAPHARVISPDDVTIYTYPCIPDYDKEKVILVFPSEESVTLNQLKVPKIQVEKSVNSSISTSETDRNSVVAHQVLNETSDERKSTGVHQDCKTEPDLNDFCSQSDCDRKRKASISAIEGCGHDSEEKQIKLDERGGRAKVIGHGAEFDNSDVSQCHPSFDRVIFIDSTWLQSKKIFSDERLKGIRQVEIKTRLTKYWRPQGNHPDTYLATIEAIYYFCVDFHKVFISDDYAGDYDNLLFFFLYTYDKVKLSKNSKKACKR